MSMYKCNLTFPPDLLHRIDEYCKANYMTRSGFVQMVSTNFLNADRMTKAMEELTALVRKMADEQEQNGSVSEVDMQQLEDIERILKLIANR